MISWISNSIGLLFLELTSVGGGEGGGGEGREVCIIGSFTMVNQFKNEISNNAVFEINFVDAKDKFFILIFKVKQKNNYLITTYNWIKSTCLPAVKDS